MIHHELCVAAGKANHRQFVGSGLRTDSLDKSWITAASELQLNHYLWRFDREYTGMGLIWLSLESLDICKRFQLVKCITCQCVNH